MKSSLVSHAAIGLLLAFSISACNNNPPSSNTYTTTQTGTLQEVQFATVVSVRDVVIQQNSAEAGQVAGGIIGGVAGSDLGQGKGSIVGGVAGAVAGSAIGGIIDKTVDAQIGIEITLKLENGKAVAIAQLADQEFKAGDTVKIITSNGKSRVTH